MTDFNKILEKAKEIEKKMKESQENLKKIEVEGISGGDVVKITLNGEGEMTIDDNRFPVKQGDVVCINDGEFHKVHNTSDFGLYFVCVFDGARRH